MNSQQGNAKALLPIGVFLIIFLGAGIITGDFYVMPAIVAFLIALLVAFLQNRQLGFQEKIAIISKGAGNENVITMSLIILCAVGFSGAVTAAGGVESTVNLGLSVLPSSVAVTGLTPFDIMPYLFYPILMAVSAMLFIAFRKAGGKDEENESNL